MINSDSLIVDCSKMNNNCQYSSENTGSSGSGGKAKKRWKLLADVLKRGHCKSSTFFNNNNNAEVSEKCQNFGLIHLETIEQLNLVGDSSNFVFCRAYLPSVENCPKLNLRILSNSVDGLQDLVGFNNTGNVRIWSSEEMMTFYCLKEKQIFENKSVVELGGGMTGLAAFFLAKSGVEMKRVFVTDGNEKCAENLKFLTSSNEFPGNLHVETGRLVWSYSMDELQSEFSSFRHSFDVCLAADCFFFENEKNSFLNTVSFLLKPGGVGLFFAPLRNGTFLKFVENVRNSKLFVIRRISDDYCTDVTRRIKEQYFGGRNSNFEYNSVFPLLLEIEKIAENGNDNFSAASDILLGKEWDNCDGSTTR